MKYVISENSSTFIINGEVYMVTKDDERFYALNKALKDDKNEEYIKKIYYDKYIKDAKKILDNL